jgi:hypothetical protein
MLLENIKYITKLSSRERQFPSPAESLTEAQQFIATAEEKLERFKKNVLIRETRHELRTRKDSDSTRLRQNMVRIDKLNKCSDKNQVWVAKDSQGNLLCSGYYDTKFGSESPTPDLIRSSFLAIGKAKGLPCYKAELLKDNLTLDQAKRMSKTINLSTWNHENIEL